MGLIAKVNGAAIYGVEALSIVIEVRTDPGTPSFQIIGLGDNSVKESRERVCSAIIQSGFDLPDRVLVNLAPADLKKEGGGFDLPIAIGILVSSKQLSKDFVDNFTFLGELSLNGALKALKGAIAAGIESQRAGRKAIVVSEQNGVETSLVSGVVCAPCASLSHVVSFLIGESDPSPIQQKALSVNRDNTKNLDDVWGQDSAKRALKIAATGGHNILMIGPPGCGKSMLAERFPLILPELTREEMLESIKIHSVVGLSITKLLNGERPYRNPHYAVSEAGLIGGGSPPRPGEITLAHNGVLFLDELPEFRRGALEALRLPLESAGLNIARSKGTVHFPARFQLIAAMNPCPCGRLGSDDHKSPCACSSYEIANYLKKISQPILDRIDLHVELSAVPVSGLTEVRKKRVNAEDLSTEIKRLHDLQRSRFGILNAYLDSDRLNQSLLLSAQSLTILDKASERLQLSARGFVRVLRVARTIADIAGSKGVELEHLSEALSYRGLERLKVIKGIR